ncbi:hypothetical protein [Kineosporia sp. NBRC 101731]|uniref:hypothetical protein n=1 Tax=Kineosporia sp. NBRC 101731 TaxID=3032199 RepID=UPI0024A0DC6A|nr:hypothetical protein [Kineosporia sp. NBRC 101731]GLY31996.1 hypothetical protein Kisp02_53610 [Kineosporia sp. NBRC 101731]
MSRATDLSVLLPLPLTVPFLTAARAHGLDRSAAFRAKRAQRLPFRLLSVGERCHQALTIDLIDHFGPDARVLDLIGDAPGIALRDLLDGDISLPLAQAGAFFRRDPSTTYFLRRRGMLPFPLVGDGRAAKAPVYGLLEAAGFTGEQIVHLRDITAASKAA